MLYVISMENDPKLAYRGGQTSIVHLEADLHETVAWADCHQRRWAFTLSNAAAYYSEDRCDLAQLDEIDWAAVQAKYWSPRLMPDGSPRFMNGKQAEFLLECSFPWELVRRVGVRSRNTWERACAAEQVAAHRPSVKILPEWYY